MKKQMMLGVLVGVIALGGVSFYLGMRYERMTRFSSIEMLPGMRIGDGMNAERRTGAMSRTQGGGVTSGEIVSKDDTGITLKLRDGGSRIIFIAPSASIQRMATGTSQDLVVGQNVMVIGTTNTDGSIKAESVQVRFGVEGSMSPQ